MSKVFANDPFARVAKYFHLLYPEKKYICFWTENNIPAEDGETAYGMTCFPDEGSDVSTVPEILISAELPVKHAVEVLAHELAHVAIGVEEGHGEAWEKAFEAIHRAYMTGKIDAGA